MRLHQNQTPASQASQAYVANVLSDFARSDAIEFAEGRKRVFKPLAHLLSEALEKEQPQARQTTLIHLGNVALFVTGFFARSFEHRATTIRYYVGMGEAAFRTAADLTTHSPACHQVYYELADKFTAFVDALNGICEQNVALADRSVGRLYEQWLQLDSQHAADLLSALGVNPLKPKPKRKSD